MNGEPQLVYVETSVFLAFLKGEMDRVEDCRSVISRGELGEITLVTSPVTLTEVIHINGNQLPDDVERYIELFFQYHWIYLIQLDRPVASRARKISREYHLKPLDSIHVASALNRGAALMLTYDDQILKIGTIGQMQIRQPSGQRFLNFVTPDHGQWLK